MARIDHGLFEDQLARAEGALGLGARGADRLRRDRRRARPAACRARRRRPRLHHHRQADGARCHLEAGIALVRALIARHAGHAGVDHAPLGRRLVAHRRDRRGRRADEDEARRRAGRGELGVLRQEAVAGMDRVGARPVRGFEDAVDAEIALAHRRRTDPDRLVGEGDVRRVAVGVGVDRDGAVAHVARRPHDPPRDLAAIGDQDLGDSIRSPISAGASRRRRAGPRRPPVRAVPRRTCRRRSRAPPDRSCVPTRITTCLVIALAMARASICFSTSSSLASSAAVSFTR